MVTALTRPQREEPERLESPVAHLAKAFESVLHQGFTLALVAVPQQVHAELEDDLGRADGIAEIGQLGGHALGKRRERRWIAEVSFDCEEVPEVEAEVSRRPVRPGQLDAFQVQAPSGREVALRGPTDTEPDQATHQTVRFVQASEEVETSFDRGVV